jgi:hypothetical protein
MVHRRGQIKEARRRCRGDGGAALVEFGLVAPILFLLVFGIVEFGWAFFQNLDVRHGAREGARLAAVNYKTTTTPTPIVQRDQIIGEICDRMDDDDGVSVLLYQPGTAAVGQSIDVYVRDEFDSLTGFLDFAIGHIDHLQSHVQIRIEQAATWQSAASTADSEFVDCP